MVARQPQPSVLGLDKTADAATATLCMAVLSIGMLEESGVFYEDGLCAPYVRSRVRFPVMFHPHTAADISS
jgi:hypothetical protein